MSSRSNVPRSTCSRASRHADDHTHARVEAAVRSLDLDTPGTDSWSLSGETTAVEAARGRARGWRQPGPAGREPRASAAACGGGLGNPANNGATAGQSTCETWQAQREIAKQRRSRDGRFGARRAMREITNLGRVAWCGKASRMPDGSVALKHTEGGSAGLGGVQTCGSVWACPVCSAKIASKRTTEVETALRWNAERGGTVALATLTMRHHSGHKLKDCWSALSAGWAAMTKHRSWRDDRKQLGMDHYIRATEVTHGENGWHVHIHCLLFFDGPISREMIEPLVDGMYDRWADGLAKTGFEVQRQHGIDVRIGQGALDGLGKYLSKLTYEAAGGRWKSGRKGGRTPFEILHDGLETGLADDIELWWEWERASKGRRQLTWSRGLKALIGLEDASDEEIAAEDDDGDTILIMPKKTWKAVEPQVEDLLTYTEQWGPEGAMRWLDSRGLRYRLPDEEPRSADLWDELTDPAPTMQ